MWKVYKIVNGKGLINAIRNGKEIDINVLKIMEFLSLEVLIILIYSIQGSNMLLMGNEYYLIIIAFLVGFNYLIIFSTKFIMNKIHNYSESKRFLALPIDMTKVFIAKFLSVYINAVVFYCAVLAPALIFHDVVSLSFYPLLILDLLIIVFIILGICTIISTLIIGLLHKTRRVIGRIVVSIIFSIINSTVIGLTLINLYSIYAFGQVTSVEGGEAKGYAINNFVWFMTDVVEGRTHGATILLGILIISIIALLIIVGKLFYGKLVIESDEEGSINFIMKRKIRGVKLNILKELVILEFKRIFNSGEAMVRMIFSYLLVFSIIISITLIGIPGNISHEISEVFSQIEVIIIASIIITYISGMANSLASTCISRDNKNLNRVKSMPIHYEKYLLSKLFVSVIISSVFMSVVGIIISIRFKLIIAEALILIFNINICNVITNLLVSIVDVKHGSLKLKNYNNRGKGFESYTEVFRFAAVFLINIVFTGFMLYLNRVILESMIITTISIIGFEAYIIYVAYSYFIHCGIDGIENER